VKTLALSSPGSVLVRRSASGIDKHLRCHRNPGRPALAGRCGRSNLDACSLAPNVGSASPDVINVMHGWLIVGGR
jgi:hypothetical protein